jgi:hypothetical protein
MARLQLEGEPEELASLHDRLPALVEGLAKAVEPHDPQAAAVLRELLDQHKHDEEGTPRPRLPAVATLFDKVHARYQEHMARMTDELLVEIAKAVSGKSEVTKKSYADLIYDDARGEHENLRMRLQRFGYSDPDFDSNGVLAGLADSQLDRLARALEAGEDPSSAFATTAATEDPCS